MNENIAPQFRKEEQRLFAVWRQEHLLESEKQAIRQSLSAHIGAKQPTFSENIHGLFSVFSYKQSLAFSLVATVFVVSGGIGVVSASERSLPGEILYPLKTSVVEPIRGTLTTGASKAAWERERIERRMGEAERLAAQGKLGENESEKIDSLITKHQTALASHSSEDDDQTLEELNIRFEKVEVEKTEKDGEVRYRLRERDDEEGNDKDDEDRAQHEESEEEPSSDDDSDREDRFSSQVKALEKEQEKREGKTMESRDKKDEGKSRSKSAETEKKKESRDDKKEESKSGSDKDDDQDDPKNDEEDDSDKGE